MGLFSVLSLRKLAREFAQDPSLAYGSAYEALRARYDVDAMYIAYYDAATRTMLFAYNVDDGIVEWGAVYPLGDGPTSRAIREDRIVSVTSRREMDEYEFVFFGDKGRSTLMQVHAPIRPLSQEWRGGPYGVISIQRVENRPFSAELIEQVCELGDLFATLHFGTDLWERSHRSAAAMQRAMGDKLRTLGQLARSATSVQTALVRHGQQVSDQTYSELLGLLRRLSALAVDPAEVDEAIPSSLEAIRTLTPRERDLLRLMPRSNKELAEELKVSEATVRYHLGRLYQKLKVSNRAELLAVIARWA